ncbi:zinc finger protein 567-like [Helicoverpa zea]|uniref:zinc finger protein 567-like n=1 Tax=Helicoverpa zea TaxID=7113 RepID=UPI001F5779E3|nr:zinc finger protein 567-like [Helicoverpa zea]
MLSLKVCRICLCKGVKMYSYDSYFLKQYYEEVMSKKINAEDSLPHHFCYLCASMLHKIHKFKEKCYTGEMALNELLCSGNLNLTKISQITSQNKTFQSTIDLVKVNKRVRTCIVKSKTMFESDSSEELSHLKIPEVDIISMDIDNSLDDVNLVEVKSEIIENNITNTDSIQDKKMNIEEKIIPNIIYTVDKDIFIPEVANNDDDDDRTTDVDDLNPTSNVATNCNEEQMTSSKTNANENIKLTKQSSNNDSEKQEVKRNKVKGKKPKSFEVKSYQILDPKHWLKIVLNEEEALQYFKDRAQDPKYLKAAFKCTLCLKGFSKEDTIKRHQIRHCESLGPIECRFCKMRFKRKCMLTIHIASHYHKYKCLRCGVLCPLFGTAVFHDQYHNGVVRTCKFCGEQFHHSSTYYTHLRTFHRSEHVCSVCGDSFLSEHGLKKHKNFKHRDTVIDPVEDKNTYCEKCDIKFETKTAYDQHKFHSAKHAEEFERLQGHIKGRRKYIRRNQPTTCSSCNKTFPSVNAYKRHCKSEHKHQPRPPQENERRICEICGISITASGVASHLNTHTREIKYPCPTCGMEFTMKASMQRHQLTHTGEKPYGCTLCDKRFTQSNSMKLHYRTFHLKEPYPKRNRRKNTAAKDQDEFRANDDSDEVILKGYHLNV